MNLRLDEHSVRLRLSLSEAQQLLANGAMRQSWSVAGLRVELELLLTTEVPQIAIHFALPRCIVRVNQEGFERALGRVPAKDSGVYSTTADGHDYAVEIDSFSAKGKRA